MLAVLGSHIEFIEKKSKIIKRDYLQDFNIKTFESTNEKISNTIFGTSMRPTVVGNINSDNCHMNYDFVSFDKVEKKDPVEYIESDKADYDINVKDKQIPASFFMIKDGEIEKGKAWYLAYDPKLPEEIAEMMARYNWGDLKYMTKKSIKNQKKKLNKKNKDITAEEIKAIEKTTNNLFVGSTAELQRMLQNDDMSNVVDITPKFKKDDDNN